MSAILFPNEPRAQFPNASRDEQEYIKYLCGVKLTDAGSSASGDDARIAKLEADNKNLLKTVDCLTSRIAELEKRFAALSAGGPAKPAAPPAADKQKNGGDDDDDVDLFGSDDEEADAEAERIKQERLQAYQEKKSKKPALVAKSSIVLDVKPWDDETDMAEMERCVRSIATDGLLWGASKLVPVGYGIKKLQIGCVVEDDKVGTDFLEEEITKFEDLVQSVDVAAFQKI
ncbi:hypothetical protein BOX15_Mlig005311g1 [Macrostomum lignano]|uniref:Elongation factor 1-beta n=2 Tax=Macrostomum lignano TaxID=282301 RepID=A0A1I8JDA6_9PLAT|nr:hypothetical protein BOX15_Mlig005311g1 [Macrostomum lignano]